MNQPLIYCVDDEENIRSLYEDASSVGGFQCVAFQDGASFFDELKRTQPDLIILDVMLPGMNGMEILEKLSHGQYSAIPVIMISAKGGESDMVKGLNLGASDYIAKPFGVMELLARVKANLRKNGFNNTITYKELTLNKQMHAFYLKDVPLSLSSKEYGLLEYLLKNAEKMVTKEELLSKIWGINCRIETRTVDMFISRVRKKISSSNVHIETLRGVGYILR